MMNDERVNGSDLDEIFTKASPRRLTLGLAVALAAIEPPAQAKPNRAKRREERKRQRQARKRGRRG